MTLCAGRIRGGCNAQLGGRLFLLALRLLLLATDLAATAVAAEPAAARIAADARNKFDLACPRAKNACDMIEHFAEYGLGKGDEQQAVSRAPSGLPIRSPPHETGRCLATRTPGGSSSGRSR